MHKRTVGKIFVFILFLLGILVGLQLSHWLITQKLFIDKAGFLIDTVLKVWTFRILIGFIFGFIFIIFIPPFVRMQEKFIKETILDAKSISIYQIIGVVIGLIIGLILAALICLPINAIGLPEWLRTILTILIYVASIYLSVTVAFYKSQEIYSTIKGISVPEEAKSRIATKKLPKSGKILDTSVIIDGRIYDILKSGFVDGPIIIPEFVLYELQLIADSSDGLKRNRGRRGLDILNKIQNDLPIEVIITDKDYQNITEVDTKLLKLASDINGKVVTNDYNLNKIAEFQGVDVLNTNELSNAVKTLVLPGEEMLVKVLKEGKEHSQGIAYLEDGTMIVVEGGRNLIGQDVPSVVTSVLQTAAGRMIFVKPSEK